MKDCDRYEFAEALAVCFSAYDPALGAGLPARTVASWWGALEPFAWAEVREALTAWALDRAERPTPALVRDLIYERQIAAREEEDRRTVATASATPEAMARSRDGQRVLAQVRDALSGSALRARTRRGGVDTAWARRIVDRVAAGKRALRDEDEDDPQRWLAAATVRLAAETIGQQGRVPKRAQEQEPTRGAEGGYVDPATGEVLPLDPPF